MTRLDDDPRAQTKASGPETTTEKEWYREYTGSPPTCLDFPDDFLQRSSCLETYTPHSMAPKTTPLTVIPILMVSVPKSELENILHSQSLSILEPMTFSRDGHDANDLASTKMCFLEESLLFDYNPTLDMSTMYTDAPAEDRGASTSVLPMYMCTDAPADRGASTSVLKLPTTNADAGHWPFEMANPTMVGETSSKSTTQNEHGMQSNQAVSNCGLSTLSAAFRVAKPLAGGDIKSPTSDIVDSAALDRSGNDPVIVLHSALVLPPNDMVAVPTKQKGSPQWRHPTKQNGSPTQKPHRETDVLMGRGGNATYHPGNKRYLIAMKKRLVQYHNSERSEKTNVSQHVVDEVHAWGGRFLKKVKGSNEYVEVSDKIARTRVSQALRDGKAS